LTHKTAHRKISPNRSKFLSKDEIKKVELVTVGQDERIPSMIYAAIIAVLIAMKITEMENRQNKKMMKENE
jgi:hypothetical protein